MTRRFLLLLIGCAVLTATCRSASQSDDSRPAPDNVRTVVSVDNQGFLDTTIYVLDGTQRVRLGVAQGHSVTPLIIPSHLVRGSAPLRFLGDPIGGNRLPVSDEIVVQPGDVVTLVIPPN